MSVSLPIAKALSEHGAVLTEAKTAVYLRARYFTVVWSWASSFCHTFHHWHFSSQDISLLEALIDFTTGSVTSIRNLALLSLTL